MRLTRRDGIVTVIAAAVVTPYIGYLVRGTMPFIQDPRGMAAGGLIGLIAGFAVWALAGRGAFGSTALTGTSLVLGLAALDLGIAALVMESELLLALFIGGIVLLLGIELLAHLGVIPGGTPTHA